MKTTELMIGDWYYWEAEGKKYPMQVTKDTFRLSDEDISNFQPISLTHEILEENGFKADPSNTRMLFRHDNYRLCYYFNSGNHFSSFNIINGSLVQKIIVNVHELQHALKLCGIDKEIVV